MGVGWGALTTSGRDNVLVGTTITRCDAVVCEEESSIPTLQLTAPPCGTPEAKRLPSGQACQQWMVRPAPVQPPDQWPPYEHKSAVIIDPLKPETCRGLSCYPMFETLPAAISY